MRIISVDKNQNKGKLNRFFSQCIGAGRAGEIMRHVPAKQLSMIQKECPFSYIRFHGLFHEEMHVVSRNEDGTLTFHFQYVDLLFDQLLENNIRPIVELGLMPETLAEDKKYVFWWKMNICMPQKIEEWEQLVDALVRHLTYRYGEAEVKEWLFEVWNEPNHPSFFKEYEKIEKYFLLYDTAARAVKRINTEYRIGGPATAGPLWIQEMIDHCKGNDVPLDFISSHDYGVRGAFDADGTKYTVLDPIEDLPGRFRKWGEICHSQGLPFIVTEWSASYSARDPVHDSYYSAPFILYTIKQIEGYADMFSYWEYTDVFEETGPPEKPFHGGFGILNVQSYKKPAYYAFTFLHRLGDTELCCEDMNTYACMDENSMQVLLWNITQPEIPNGNREYFMQPLPAKKLEDVVLELKGFVPNRSYQVVCETVGYRKGDVYNAYLERAFQELPTREEEEMLKVQSKPMQTIYEVIADAEGCLKFSLPQCENQVDFMSIAYI